MNATARKTAVQLADSDGVIPAPGARSAGAHALALAASADMLARYQTAKLYPRDTLACRAAIENTFSRTRLAEVAQYEYAKGGTQVTGPSIRAAEALVQYWENVGAGYQVMGQFVDAEGVTVSEVRAFAVDYQAMHPEEVTFYVRHFRQTRTGGYKLTDDREVYELVANMAARRKRACILAVIPGDVVEDAMAQAELTLKAQADTSPEAQARMVEAFTQFGVTREMIEARIQRSLDSISPAQVVVLKRIWASLRDGMSQPGQWFDVKTPSASMSAVKAAVAPAPKPANPPPVHPTVPPAPRPRAPVFPDDTTEPPPWDDDGPGPTLVEPMGELDPAIWLKRIRTAQDMDDLQALGELIALNFPDGPDRALLDEALAHRDAQLSPDDPLKEE